MAQARILQLEGDYKAADERGIAMQSERDKALKNYNDALTTLGECRTKLAGAQNVAEERKNTVSSLRDTIADLQRMNGLQSGYIQRVNEDEHMAHNRDARRIGPMQDGGSFGRVLTADEHGVGDIYRRREYRS